MKRPIKRIVARLKKRAARNAHKGKGYRSYAERLKAQVLEALAS